MTTSPGSSGPAPLVLLVEDAHDQRHMYASYLTVHGFRVETAADGPQGLRMALMVQPDVIVMDLSLPHLDGWETTRRLKHDTATADVPVIALTARVENRAVELAREVGCDAYVVKPCLPRDLVDTLNRVLAGRRRPALPPDRHDAT
jgi:CheY-like chemotaxis protein